MPPKPRYAAETDVPVARSRAEIEALLERYGATGFGYATDESLPAAVIFFRLDSRHYRIFIPLPRRDDPALRQRVGNQYRDAGAVIPGAYERLLRSRWRTVAKYIHMTLEAAEDGFITVEQALLAHLLLPDGATVGKTTADPIATMYATGQVQPLIPGLEPPPTPARLLPPG